MTTNITILCPHNAAKSAFVSALLAREVHERDLDITIATAGTEPDDDILPVVKERLHADGFEPATVPRLATAADFDSTDLVINIGCDLSGFPAVRDTREWKIPNFFDGPDAAFAALEEHTLELAEELVQSLQTSARVQPAD